MRIRRGGRCYNGAMLWNIGKRIGYRFVGRNCLFLLIFLLNASRMECEEMLVPEKNVELKRLQTDLLKNYDRLANLPTGGAKRGTAVWTFFDAQYIVSMPTKKDKSAFETGPADEKYQILTMKGTLMMQWTDQRLAWRPENYSSIRGLHFSPKEIWVPEIYSVFNVKYMDLSDSSTPASVYNNGSVKWYVPVVFDVPCRAQYKHYPYDSHNCTIHLAPWKLETIYLFLQDSQASSTNTIQGTEWTVARITHKNITLEGLEEQHILVRVLLQRASRLYRYICIIPTLVSMVSLLFGFWLLPDETSRYLVGCCNIIVLSMLLQHLAVTVPAGKVIPLLAQYCASCLCMSAVFIIITVVASLLRECSGMPPNGLVRLAHSTMDRYLCIFAFAHVSSRSKMAESSADGSAAESTSPDEAKRRRDWYTVAIIFDRIAFWCFVFIFVVLLAVLAAV